MKVRKIIGYIMVKTEMTVPEFAKSISRNKVNVYAVINGTSKSPAIRKEISKAIRISVNDIWPEPAKEGRK